MKIVSSLILGACILGAGWLISNGRDPLPLVESAPTPAPAAIVSPTGKLDFSDLVLIDDNTYLIVSDYKIPIHPGYRVSLLTIKEGELEHVPIPVPDWKDSDGGPSDLEACCGIPGRDNEYLLAESGPFNGKFGRFFHVALGETDELKPGIAVKGVMRIFDRQLDERSRAFSGDQIEGIACFESNGKKILVYGERGGETAGGIKNGNLVWGELDLKDYQFVRLGEAPICKKSILEGRDCGSLQLIATDAGWSVIAVATNDPGEDGPFQSVIYRAGEFVIDNSGNPVFKSLDEPEVLSRLSGLKVEGIARPPKVAPESTFTISTDDEAFGAIVRTVRVDAGL